MDPLTVLVALLALAVGALTVIVFGLLRTHAEILRALDRAGVGIDDSDTGSLPVGPVAVAPPTASAQVFDIAGTVPGGGAAKIGVSGVGHFTLLAFLSSGCRTCATFWEEFADPDVSMPGHGTRLVIVAQDPAHDSESAIARLAPRGVRTVCSTAAWQAYEVPGSPYFVLVDGESDRVIGSGSATSWEQVRGLLDTAIGDSELDLRRRTRGGRSARRGSRRQDRVDDALAAAGIGPGHASLWPTDPHDSESSTADEQTR